MHDAVLDLRPTNWFLCALIVATFVGLALAGLFISRPIVGWLVGRRPSITTSSVFSSPAWGSSTGWPWA